MFATTKRKMWNGLMGVFVTSQLATAGLAVSGHHHHAWDAGSHEPVCWACLAISLASIAAVAFADTVLREDLAG